MTSRTLVVRRGSLVVLLLWLAVLAVDLARRQLGVHPPEHRPDIVPERTDVQDPVIRHHTGFVYSDTLGGVPSFRMAAREADEHASGWYEFHDVQVSLYHEGEVAYGLITDRLRYEPSRHEAETLGAAQVSLQGGIALRSGGFKLGGPERLLESEGPVTFAGPSWGGLAGGARCSLEHDTIELLGGVSVTWRADAAAVSVPLVLLAPRLVHERRQGTIHFPDGLTLLRNRLQLRAASGDFRFAGAEGGLRQVALTGPVTVDGTLDDGGAIRGLAGDAVIDVLAGERLRVVGEPAAATGWVSLDWEDAAFGWRELTAWRVTGEGTRSAWEWLEGQGHACAREFRAEGEARSIDAGRMRVDFQDGNPRVANAHEAVRVEIGDSAARGEDLQFSLASRTFTLLPAAGRRVELSAPDGDSECDLLEGGEGGAVVARGDVVGQLARGSIAGASSAPVRFAAATAKSADQGSVLDLDGDARLWQNDRLLRADHLEYDRRTEIVSGTGGVLTTAKTVDKTGRTGNAEIRSRQLRYDRTAGIATYDGDVSLVDARGTAACQRLIATLSDKGGLILAELEDGVTLDDKASGRVVRGQRARYVIDDGFLEIWGTPVLITDATGNQIKAQHVQWRRNANTVVLLGTEDSLSETQYHSSAGKPAPTARPRRTRP